MLEIVFWDVQHGDAIYIKTPNGKHIIQDLGTGSYGRNDRQFSPLCHIRNHYGVSRLDQVIITHPHKDHIDDILNFDGLNPYTLLRPRNLPKEDIMRHIRREDKYLFEKYFEIDQRYSQPVPPQQDPTLPENNGGVNIQFFHPISSSTSNINNRSIVTVLSYADSKVILPGDNEPPSWKELLEKPSFVDAIKNADILLAPHHGRETGYHDGLFEHFKPKLTVVSDGQFCDTSATKRYSQKSTGWTVCHRQGEKEERYCVTTRNDGVIVVKLGYNTDRRPFISVSVE